MPLPWLPPCRLRPPPDRTPWDGRESETSPSPEPALARDDLGIARGGIRRVHSAGRPRRDRVPGRRGLPAPVIRSCPPPGQLQTSPWCCADAGYRGSARRRADLTALRDGTAAVFTASPRELHNFCSSQSYRPCSTPPGRHGTPSRPGAGGRRASPGESRRMDFWGTTSTEIDQADRASLNAA
jgi:hypothetical protein